MEILHYFWGVEWIVGYFFKCVYVFFFWGGREAVKTVIHVYYKTKKTKKGYHHSTKNPHSKGYSGTWDDPMPMPIPVHVHSWHRTLSSDQLGPLVIFHVYMGMKYDRVI